MGKDKEPVLGKSFIVIVSLEKIYVKSPGDSALIQLKSIAEESVRKTPGWEFLVNRPAVKEEYRGGAFQKVCSNKIQYRFAVGEKDSYQQVLYRAQRIVGDTIHFAESKSRGWRVLSASGPNNYVFDLEEAKRSKLLLGRIETAFFQLPKDWKSYFESDIYGLDPQVRITWDAITSCIRSSYQKRSHICYHGQPGSGKTTVCERFYEMISEMSPEGAVLRFTASQTTKAGLENILIDADPKPSLIFVEEIDKAPPENMSCLLDVCNTEGKIKKTNALVGNIEIPLQTLVICTVNNVPKFKSFLSGALASRFAHKIFFPRPNDEVLKLIGLREIRKYNGESAWVDKALSIMKKEGTNDPRRLRAFLDGGKRLMDKSYEKDMEVMRKAMEKESEELIASETQHRLHSSIDLTGL